MSRSYASGWLFSNKSPNLRMQALHNFQDRSNTVSTHRLGRGNGTIDLWSRGSGKSCARWGVQRVWSGRGYAAVNVARHIPSEHEFWYRQLDLGSTSFSRKIDRETADLLSLPPITVVCTLGTGVARALLPKATLLPQELENADGPTKSRAIRGILTQGAPVLSKPKKEIGMSTLSGRHACFLRQLVSAGLLELRCSLPYPVKGDSSDERSAGWV